MRKSIFALLVLAISLFGTQCWAATCFPAVEATSCTNTFSPGTTSNTYEFGNNGRLTVTFVQVLTTFTLTVTYTHTIDPIDFNVFPTGTLCVKYAFNGSLCDQYNFTGSANGPNGVPVKNIDYKGLIRIELSYLTFQAIHKPAFGHAPGDITTITENILIAYSSSPVAVPDPTMCGDAPGLSSVVALDEPGPKPASFCYVSPTPNQTFSAATVPVIEVIFQFSSDPSGTCPINGTPLRDKTAGFTLSTTDINGNVVFVPILDREEANKFHWDNTNRENEFDLSTVGLATGTTYTITVFSDKFSPPQEISFTLNP